MATHGRNRYRRHLPSMLGLVLGLLLVKACIPVLDLSEAWERAELDRDLEGYWWASDPETTGEEWFLSFRQPPGAAYYIARSHRASQAGAHWDGDEAVPVKSLIREDHRFLLVRPSMTEREDGDAEAPHGSRVSDSLQRYAIEDDVLTLYDPDLPALLRIARERGLAVQVDREGKVIDAEAPAGEGRWVLRGLDAATLDLLEEMADRPDLWQVRKRWRRVESLYDAWRQAHVRTWREHRAWRAARIADEEETAPHFDFGNRRLTHFAGPPRELLLSHLRFSPEWQVTPRWEVRLGGDRARSEAVVGEYVAYQRQRTDEAWTLDRLHRQRQGDGKEQIARIAFHFTEVPRWGRFAGELIAIDLQSLAPPSGRVHSEPVEEGLASTAVAGQKGLWTELHEVGPTRDRPVTQRARTEVLWMLLELVRAHEDEVRQRRYTPHAMPANGIQRGEPELTVALTEEPDVVEVRAWLNPGADGAVYLRVIDPESNEPLAARRIEQQSTEFIGWEDDPDQLFFYQQQVIIRDRGRDAPLEEGRFELWFRPADDGEERLLLQTFARLRRADRR